MKKWFADVTKWVVIIIVALIAFYVACPKYHFEFFQTETGEEIVAAGYDGELVSRVLTLVGRAEHKRRQP